ncbi:23S rRNA pseudouridine2604 synthase [Aromatoleum tolulyticum]|uniref:Dual-specificity RNA pseudouridine synthase RluF n=1 Tax=Aromatoleum tolulyticum TaxID=34027 RepID=A0A1N7A894_9RHOO|nr:pseudouridine synthase [Aromatoleum tolulyticum]SIR35254.1 23S rRNA pseudouridine2604 synthase [Aromatoleum tolulyticum]
MKRSKEAGTPGDVPAQEDAADAPRRTLGVKRQGEAPVVEGARRAGVRARFQPGYAKTVAATRALEGEAQGKARGGKAGRPPEAARAEETGRGRRPERPKAAGVAGAERRPRKDGDQPRTTPGGERPVRKPERPNAAGVAGAERRPRKDGDQPRTTPGGERPVRKPERPNAAGVAGAERRPRKDGDQPRTTPGGERPVRKPAAKPAAPAPRAPVARRDDRPVAARPAARAEAAPTAAAEGVRLSKVMSERGLCSRREADGFIERGWVLVDGQRVSELGTRIDPNAEITLAPQARRRQSERVTILLHKPVGYVSGQPEPGYEPAVSLIGAGNQFDRDTAQTFDFSHLKGLAPAGRLDIDSTGLLVLTQDGRIARQLIGDDSEVDKEYLVRVEGSLDEHGLALLNHGLELDGRKLRRAKVEWINEDQLRFVLREGRKRQIRRMCELVGLKVVGLKRIRIGRIRLGDLPLGQWRFLREDEGF